MEKVDTFSIIVTKQKLLLDLGDHKCVGRYDLGIELHTKFREIIGSRDKNTTSVFHSFVCATGSRCITLAGQGCGAGPGGL